MLYIISPGLIYFITVSLYFFDYLHPFCLPPHTLPLITTSLFTGSMSSVFVCLFVAFLHLRNAQGAHSCVSVTKYMYSIFSPYKKKYI